MEQQQQQLMDQEGEGFNNNMLQLPGEFFDESDFPFDEDVPQIVAAAASHDEENHQNNGMLSGHPSDPAAGNNNGESSQNPNKRKKKYQRHTAEQIQRLEAHLIRNQNQPEEEHAFKECPHLDETLRNQLSHELGMTTKQVRFWFQNKRTLTKAKTERDNNLLLKVENDKLRTENAALKEALRRLVCKNCGTSLPPDENALIMENAQLRKLIVHASTNAGNIEAQQLPDTIGLASTESAGATGSTSPILPMSTGSSSTLQPMETGAAGVLIPAGLPTSSLPESFCGMVQNSYWMIELALNAMNELIGKTVESNTSLWTNGLYGTTAETLNYSEYVRKFPPVLFVAPSNFVYEATKETDVVRCSCQALTHIFMNSEIWMKMFPSLISTASTVEVIASSVTKNETIQLMEAEFQVLSPMVPLCKVKFLRYCKQYALGKWALADVSVDSFTEIQSTEKYLPFRLLPSGCIIEELPNDCSKVTWVAHYEYDDNYISPLYRPMLRAGLGFGSTTWLARLKRQCESISLFTASADSRENRQSIPINRQRGLLKLGQCISDCFCYGVCSSKFHWVNILTGTSENDYVFLKSRVSMDDPSKPHRVVLSTATSFWLPVTKEVLFHKLKNEWDLLSQGSKLHKFIHMQKDRENDNNCISVFRCSTMVPDSKMVIQETWSDASASFIAYAPLEISDIHNVFEGADPSSITILPSGFAIHSDGQVGQPWGIMSNLQAIGNHLPIIGNIESAGGSLLTIGFQILANGDPCNGIDTQCVQLIRHTVEKIKASIGINH